MYDSLYYFRSIPGIGTEYYHVAVDGVNRSCHSYILPGIMGIRAERSRAAPWQQLTHVRSEVYEEGGLGERRDILGIDMSLSSQP